MKKYMIEAFVQAGKTEKSKRNVQTKTHFNKETKIFYFILYLTPILNILPHFFI